MGVGIIGVLLSHLIQVGGFDTGNYLVQALLSVKQFVYTQGFLFLSGFGLYFSLRKNSDTVAFYKRRCTRLLIPFLIMAFPFFLIQVIARKESWLYLFGRLTTLSFWVEGNYSGMWYVAISMLLYLLFPIYYKIVFGRNRNDTSILRMSLGGVILSVVVVYISRQFQNYEMLEIGISKIPAFFIGPVFAFLLSKKDTRLLKENFWHMLFILSIWVVVSVFFL